MQPRIPLFWCMGKYDPGWWKFLILCLFFFGLRILPVLNLVCWLSLNPYRQIVMIKILTVKWDSFQLGSSQMGIPSSINLGCTSIIRVHQIVLEGRFMRFSFRSIFNAWLNWSIELSITARRSCLENSLSRYYWSSGTLYLVSEEVESFEDQFALSAVVFLQQGTV